MEKKDLILRFSVGEKLNEQNWVLMLEMFVVVIGDKYYGIGLDVENMCG